MTTADKLRHYLDIKPAEEKNFRMLFIQSLLTGFSTSFYFVVCSTYFIKLTGIAELPTGYILSGIFGYLLISFYKRLQNRSGIASGFTTFLYVYAVVTLLLYVFRLSAHNDVVQKVIAYVGFVCIMPFSTMLALGFSTVCLRIFNISQSKRLLALIGTGEVIASIIAYLIVPFLNKLLGGPVHLLLFATATTLAAIIPLRNIYAHNKSKLDTVVSEVVATPKKFNFVVFTKEQYYLLIAIVTFFSVMAIYFADYTYLVSVKYISTETGIELASIVAVIFSVIKAGELGISLASGKIISGIGMKYSMALLPILLVVFSFVAATSGFLLSSIPFLLVFFLLLNKWSERAVRKGVTAPVLKVLYQVAEPHERAALQTSIDGTVTQVATIFAGVVLLIISLIFKHYDIFSFLKTTAVVCFVAFTLWGWLMYKLYNSYRAEISAFLHKLHNRKYKDEAEGIDTTAKQQLLHVDKAALVNGLVNKTGSLDKKSLLDYIINYNLSQKGTILEKPDSLQQLTKVYVNNENLFSRILIIRYLQFLPKGSILQFIKEFYGISDKTLRLEMLAVLNRSGQHIPAEDRFYFANLCSDAIEEILWAESAINDIGNNNEHLAVQTQAYAATMKNLLFELLKVIYDSASIQVIQNIINTKEQSIENQLFAVELLDNTLEPELKKVVIPLFEDLTYNARKNKLKNIFIIYNLSYEDRLKDIIMKDFKLVDPAIKQLALEEYYKLTHDKTVLAAFSSSAVENLNAVSNALIYTEHTHPFFNKLKVAHSTNIASLLHHPVLPYYLQWGMLETETKRQNTRQHTNFTYQYNPDNISTVSLDNCNVKLDIFGLALLLKLQEQ